MKKIILCLMVVLLAFSFAACGQTDKPTDNNGVSSNTSTTDATKPQNKGITMDDLLNHPETPSTDFVCMEDENGVVSIERYLGNDEIVVLPNQIDGKPIKRITNYVFANDSSVKAIRLSNSIEVIDDYAFAQNKELQLVVCGKNLKSIGLAAFQGCESLHNINLPDGLESIGKFAVSKCSALTKIEIPTSVTSIDDAAFYLQGDDFIIVAESGSYAENFAKNKSIKFQAK